MGEGREENIILGGSSCGYVIILGDIAGNMKGFRSDLRFGTVCARVRLSQSPKFEPCAHHYMLPVFVATEGLTCAY